MLTLSIWEHDFRVEETAGDSCRYGDQITLSAEDFDVAGAREFGKVHGAPGVNAGDGRFVGSDGGKLRQKLARVDEEGGCVFVDGNSRFLHYACLPLRGRQAPVGMTDPRRGHVTCTDFLDFLYGVGLGDFEFRDGGAAE